MPTIKVVEKYTVPKYPHGAYYPRSEPALVGAGKGVFATAALALMLEACEGGGTAGPPPIQPTFVTEMEARTVINRVFTRNGISLVEDFMLQFERSTGVVMALEIDGYNESLRVGYEYISEVDRPGFPIEELVLASRRGGPYIKTVNQIDREGNYQSHLEEAIQNFIDSLRADGII